MKLYHGSTVAVEAPRIIRSDFGRDFGFGFYTTDIKEQAERWALRRRRTAQRNGIANARAVVSVYEFDLEAARNSLMFKDYPSASMDGLELVVACRSDKDFTHPYDVVTGKIANDSVGETVSYVLAGVMRKEDAIERLKFQQINDQLAFCSEHALTFLKYISNYVVEA
ncbi:MAG: DUF3990 domain-containing protein [Paludibacteraceae bacterium]|nr:DUF3990 domain-containing protein [Paludibacteraceae bacterium]